MASMELSHLLEIEIEGLDQIEEILERQRGIPITAGERREQMVSYVMSMLPRSTNLSREQVRELVEAELGKIEYEPV